MIQDMGGAGTVQVPHLESPTMTDVNQEPTPTDHHHTGAENGYQVTFDAGDSVSDLLRETIVELDERAPQNLPALDDVVDTDALDALFAPRVDGEERSDDSTLSLTYAGYDVRVHANGLVVLSALRSV